MSQSSLHSTLRPARPSAGAIAKITAAAWGFRAPEGFQSGPTLVRSQSTLHLCLLRRHSRLDLCLHRSLHNIVLRLRMPHEQDPHSLPSRHARGLGCVRRSRLATSGLSSLNGFRDLQPIARTFWTRSAKLGSRVEKHFFESSHVPPSRLRRGCNSRRTRPPISLPSLFGRATPPGTRARRGQLPKGRSFMAACGRNHTLAAGENAVFAWGIGGRGQLGCAGSSLVPRAVCAHARARGSLFWGT